MDQSIKEKLSTFFSQYKELIYKKGDIIIRADENPTGILYLTEGFIRVYAISQKGDEIVLNIFKPFAFFPMSWAMNNTQNSYYFEAMSPTVTLKKAPREEVLKFIQENSDILYDLLKRVYKGTDGMLARMEYLMSGSARTRLLTEIIINAKRFGMQDQDQNRDQDKKDSIKIAISEKDLATQTGLTRETVNREIKLLKEKKLLEILNNTLAITSLSALEKELYEL